MKVALFKSTSRANRPANIRGKEISQPIPIPEPDEEFPIRQPATRLATSFVNDSTSQPQVQAEGSSIVANRNSTGPTPDVVPEERTDSAQRSGRGQVSVLSNSPAQRRSDRSSTIRYSTLSTGSTPRRERSTLRSTLGRIFGRRKKRGSGEGLETHREDQHRSDPSPLTQVRKESGEPKRSASLPITEFDRALRSHSIGPDDIFAIESARNSLNEPIHKRRGRAATSSRLYDPRSKEYGDLIGLSPRPASTHGRTSQDALGQDDPENIGRAITSDTLTQRRRSRSLSQLKDLGLTQRKRSDEIRYWRESYDPGFQSPTSSNALENEDTGNITLDLPPPSRDETQPRTPLQPFQFGPLTGMKITQAASLEDRLSALELRTQKIENLVARMFELVPGVNQYAEMPQQDPPRSHGPPSVANTTSTLANPTTCATTAHDTRYTGSGHSNDSFGAGHTFVAGADRYVTILGRLEAERTAREALESQVVALSNKISMMSRSPSRLEALVHPTGMPYSAFDHDDDDDENQALTVDDNLSESEAFKTPREEYSQHGFGAFGEELSHNRRTAARTLSLSQLTVSKIPRPTTETGVAL